MFLNWFKRKENNSELLKSIFPNYLLDELNLIEKNLDFTSEQKLHKPFAVFIEGTQINIPQRSYLDSNQLKKIKFLRPIQKEISYCFFSRHHDGYIRQRCLEKILNSNNYFVMPFIMQLLGEYVIEIIEVIYQNREGINKENLVKYIAENPKHYHVTRQRVYSYWNCNYRKFYPKYGRGVRYRGKCHLDYPGIKMLKYINNLVKK